MPTEKVYFWPQWLADSLPTQTKKLIPKNVIRKLGRANTCLWRALNIYDDFLDGCGRPSQLPVANRYYRQYFTIYYNLKLPLNFYQLMSTIMDDLDLANREEVLYQNFPIHNGRLILPALWPEFKDLRNLSRKSLALSLSPIAILFILNPKINQIKIQKALTFFRYALAAKQLADDAKDWLDDLKKGTITAANLPLLKAAKKRGVVLNLDKHPEIAYLLFANDVSQLVSAQLAKLCRQAELAAKQINISSQSCLVKNIIGPLKAGLAEAAEFRSFWLKNSQKML
jgi:hypothetical protein